MSKLPFIIVACAVIASSDAQLVLSGNENKIDLTSGKPRAVPNAAPDSITLLDFSSYPPSVRHVEGISNSVIGPPSNIAIVPDGSIALICDSIKADVQSDTGYIPSDVIHVLDLTQAEPKVIETIHSDQQPSGISISRDGNFAIVANRAAGTLSLLAINGKNVSVKETVSVCKPEESVSDVAISPDGRFAIASVQKGRFLALIRIEGGHLVPTERKFSVFGEPYRCLITPDGELALTGGTGYGFPDMDALSVVDLRAEPPRVTEFVEIGSVPESIELSPDGKLLAAVMMAGSNLAPGTPGLSKNGELVLLARRGRTFEKVQVVPTGAIPEGVAFTSDGRFVLVQCHPAREIWIFEVTNGLVTDTGVRVKTPGMPSSLRAAPAR
ncbi:MAG: hypothetical protein AMXMBFR84_22650 [Candidatus Hydrogenedentota bacterium]